jgi:hypothetical protein
MFTSVDVPSEYQKVLDQILAYEEPIEKWQINKQGQVHDSGLSIDKARVTAAGAILLQITQGKEIPRQFTVVSRDYNLASCDWKFWDKPGYEIQETDDQQVREDPLTQVATLYYNEHGEHIYTVNSVGVIDFHLRQVLQPDDLLRLIQGKDILDSLCQFGIRLSFTAWKTQQYLRELIWGFF